jgi:hypothetical protein
MELYVHDGSTRKWWVAGVLECPRQPGRLLDAGAARTHRMPIAIAVRQIGRDAEHLLSPSQAAWRIGHRFVLPICCTEFPSVGEIPWKSTGTDATRGNSPAPRHFWGGEAKALI